MKIRKNTKNTEDCQLTACLFAKKISVGLVFAPSFCSKYSPHFHSKQIHVNEIIYDCDITQKISCLHDHGLKTTPKRL